MIHVFQKFLLNVEKKPVKGMDRLIRSLVPGFRVTNIYMFYRNRRIAVIFNTLRLHLPLLRGLQIAVGIKRVSFTELVILFRLAVCRFSTEAYTSTSRCCSGRNWSKLGVHKMRQKTIPN